MATLYFIDLSSCTKKETHKCNVEFDNPFPLLRSKIYENDIEGLYGMNSMFDWRDRGRHQLRRLVTYVSKACVARKVTLYNSV